MASIALETERLLLRLPVAADVPAAAELLTDPEVMRFLGGETVPREHVGDVVERWLERWRTIGMGPFMIERQADGRVLGRAGILVWDSRCWQHTTPAAAGPSAQPELGWALARSAWGHGYATEAARAVRDWARAERDVEHLISLIAPDNTASQGVARRLGATPGATVRLFDSGDVVVWTHPAPG